jgi:hypothetical protein
MALCVAAYLGYAYVLGGFDGLPTIPDGYLKQAEGELLPQYPVSRTIEQLQQAFGPDSPEAGTSLEYKNRLQLQRHDGVIACGSPVVSGTPTVTVAPVSVALFGKRSARAKPGEVPDISTFHADKSVLKFDRPIIKVDDMFTAKVVSIELVSDPDDDPDTPTAKKDRRKGRIWISHNRQSLDPADHVVIRTTGPVYVDLPDETAPYDPNVPHIQTTALVEVFDRRNLPRKLREREIQLRQRFGTPNGTWTAVQELTESVPPVAALARPDDLRKPGAIADILTGATLPPPTVTARGLKVFLAPSKKAPGQPSRGASFSNVRRLVLSEQVQMNLWADGTSGFPGSEPDQPKKAQMSPNADPPPIALALIGGLLDGGTLADRLEHRSLLLIETPGSFTYDLENGLATFDIAPLPLPDQSNYVVSTRLSALNQTDYLVCSKLLLDLSDPSKSAKPGEATPPTDNGLVVRSVTALGPQVYASIQAEGLEASGAELRYIREPNGKRTVTTLRGTRQATVIVQREGSKLTAGDTVSDAVVEIVATVTGEGAKSEKTTLASVVGPGRLQIVDRTGGDQTGVARWSKQLKHEKTMHDGRPVDLFKFEENAAFVDGASGFNLKGQSIWLWMSGMGKVTARSTSTPGKSSGGAKPERLVATGDVHVDSDELVVRQNHKFTVWFRDVAPPPTPPPHPPAALPLPADPQADATAKADPPKPKKPIPNPLRVHADTVETWVERYPLPPEPGTLPGTTKSPKQKYELKTARCEDHVEVTQDPDPNDPARPANGIFIKGNRLTLDHAPPSGSVLTVVGGVDRDRWAEVTFDGTTIFAQAVVIDQPNNEVSVDGPGRLKSLTASDVTGNDLSHPSLLQVDWRTKMRFEGAKMFARFAGGVVVHQEVKPDPPGIRSDQLIHGERLPAPRMVGPANTTTNKSNVWCHQLDLTLDRPVYFNQLRKDDRNKAATASANPDRKGGGEGRPKIRGVAALPNDDPTAAEVERAVIYRETAFEPDGSLARGRLLTAKLMDFANRTKDEEWVRLDAIGPGELRIYQAETENNAPTATDPNTRVSAKLPDGKRGELKLTVVSFASKMTGKDKGNSAFQEAKFDDGAEVMNVPASGILDRLDETALKRLKVEPEAILAAELEPHALPRGSMYLKCRTTMTVTSAKSRPDAPADQRLVAEGDAIFRDDTRTGTGETIRYDGTRVTLEGVEKRLAVLQMNKRGTNTEQSTRAKKFVYNSKTGRVEVSESSGGTFGSGK